MKPINFDGANAALGPPMGMTEDEVRTLPVFTDGRVCSSVWVLDDDEIQMLIRSRQIVLHVMSGSTQPPVLLEVRDPYESTP
jgi:hypothetical protein